MDIDIDIEKIENRYRNLEEKLAFAKSEIKLAKKDKRRFKKRLLNHEKARWVFAEVSKQIQIETKSRIEKLITLALRSVFEREFTFKMKLEHKANKIYAIPTIIEGGEEFNNLKEDLGGSMVDIVSLAMKIVLWSMESPQRRNLFIVDEPFRFTGRLVKKAGYMLKYLSKELNFQVIIVTHDDELIEICDRVYGVRHDGNHSIVTLIKGNKRKIKRR
jgi:DNA repair exonuclease SbcCD ATPase subunit